MAEERRSAPRARISGVSVTYEDAAGVHVETDALNLGRGGLFVRAAPPLATGKRLTLDIQVAGELVPWSALGRVIWTRQRNDEERGPPGMGLKFIDVEDAVVAEIDRLVAERLPAGSPPEQKETTEPLPIVPAAPSRERTILGMGSFPPPHRPAAPDDRNVTPEHSIAIDLVAANVDSRALPRRSQPKGSPASASPTRDQHWNEALPPPEDDDGLASSRPSDVKRRSAVARWVVVVVLLMAAALAAYAALDGGLERVLRLSEWVAPTQTRPPTPVPVAPLPTVTAPAPSTASAAPTITASASSAPAGTTTTSGSPSSAVAGPPRKALGASPISPIGHPNGAKRPTNEEGNPY